MKLSDPFTDFTLEELTGLIACAWTGIKLLEEGHRMKDGTQLADHAVPLGKIAVNKLVRLVKATETQ